MIFITNSAPTLHSSFIVGETFAKKKFIIMTYFGINIEVRVKSNISNGERRYIIMDI